LESTPLPAASTERYHDLRNGSRKRSRISVLESDESRLRGGDYQLLPDEEAIAIGEGVLFEDRLLRDAEAGRDSG